MHSMPKWIREFEYVFINEEVAIGVDIYEGEEALADHNSGAGRAMQENEWCWKRNLIS